MFRTEDIVAIHVAHELFHHIEKVKIGFVSRKFTVTTLKLGPIRLKSGIRSLSEIAAHAFTKALLDMDHSPKLLDYFISEEKTHELWKLIRTKRE